MSNKATNDLQLVFKDLLQNGVSGSQIEIVEILKKSGFNVNQSKVSRLLTKFGAVKIRDANQELIYCIPSDVSVPIINSQIKELVQHIDYNQHLVLIKTSPGAAQVIARLLDSLGKKQGILGTIAGDDTIFIAPTDVNDIESLCLKVKDIFKI